MPISHRGGPVPWPSLELVKQLAENGQIATQYVDLAGNPTADIHFNPNNSVWAIEGITSPDGRVLGKMGHTERTGPGLYQNVPRRLRHEALPLRGGVLPVRKTRKEEPAMAYYYPEPSHTFSRVPAGAGLHLGGVHP